MNHFNQSGSLRVEASDDYRDEDLYARMAIYEQVRSAGRLLMAVNPYEGGGDRLRVLLAHYGASKCLRGDVPSYAARLAVRDDIDASQLKSILAALDASLRVMASVAVTNQGFSDAANVEISATGFGYQRSQTLDTLRAGAVSNAVFDSIVTPAASEGLLFSQTFSVHSDARRASEF